MSGYNDWENEDFDADERGGNENPIKALRKIEREQKAQIKELTEQLEAMRSQVRERSVKDVLASKGLNERIAKFIPAEMSSSDDIEAWVSENADVFGASVPATAPEPTQGGAKTTDPDAAAWQRIAATQSSGSIQSGDAGQIESLIKAASSPEELNKILFGRAGGPSVA